MKFTIDQHEFAALTTWAASALAARPAHPADAGILISAAAGSITVTGTNYESSCRSHAVADVEADGQALVPGRFLGQLAGQLPKREPVTVHLDGPAVRITCGPSRWTLPVLDAGQYPVMPEMPPPVATMTASDFAEAVAAVACAASSDDTLPMLTSICMEASADGTITLASTDRYRVHVAQVPATIVGDIPAVPIMLPARVLAAYAKGADAKVTFCAAAGEEGDSAPQVGFADGGRMLVSRPLAGEFVKWRGQFGKWGASLPYTVILDAALTSQAADRCSLAAGKEGIELEFDGAGTVSVAAASDDGSQGTETAPGVTYDGDPFRLRINPDWLTDALGNCGSPRAAIRLASPDKAFILTPAPPGGDQDELSEPLATPFTALIVPLRVQK